MTDSRVGAYLNRHAKVRRRGACGLWRGRWVQVVGLVYRASRPGRRCLYAGRRFAARGRIRGPQIFRLDRLRQTPGFTAADRARRSRHD